MKKNFLSRGVCAQATLIALLGTTWLMSDAFAGSFDKAVLGYGFDQPPQTKKTVKTKTSKTSKKAKKRATSTTSSYADLGGGQCKEAPATGCKRSTNGVLIDQCNAIDGGEGHWVAVESCDDSTSENSGATSEADSDSGKMSVAERIHEEASLENRFQEFRNKGDAKQKVDEVGENTENNLVKRIEPSDTFPKDPDSGEKLSGITQPEFGKLGATKVQNPSFIQGDTEKELSKPNLGGTAASLSPAYQDTKTLSLNDVAIAPSENPDVPASSNTSGALDGSANDKIASLNTPQGTPAVKTVTSEGNATPPAPSEGGDDCQASVDAVSSGYGNGVKDGGRCGHTRTAITLATVGATVGEQVANTATSLSNQLTSSRAAASGKTSEIYSSTAKMERLGASVETTLGTANVGAGAYLLTKISGHQKNSGVFQAELKKQNATLTAANKEIRILEPCAYKTKEEAAMLPVCANWSPRLNAAKAKAESSSTAVEQLQIAMKEQASVASEAKQAAAMALTKGGGQLLQAGLTFKAANEMDKAANNMRDAESKSGTVVGTGFNLDADSLAPRGSQVITGNGTTDPAQNPVTEEDKKKDTADLGSPLGNTAPDGLNSPPPAPGQFVAKDPTGGGGGGGGGIGGASTGAAGSSGEGGGDPKRAEATGGSYETAGGGGGGGGRGGAFGGGDKGLDLNGMLAQFLPKKEDEPQGNGIMSFAQRNPASEPDAILGKDANLWKRVENKMKDKYAHGFLR